MAKYIEGLNVENCNKLLEWLDAGAPHAVFDITVGSACVIEYKDDDGHFMDPFVEHQVKTKGIGDCGTVCCIAGAAAALKLGDISTPVQGIEFTGIANLALDFLGLEKQSGCHDPWLLHDLFDPDLAPSDCTPQQAAAALRRVMVGEEPWEE